MNLEAPFVITVIASAEQLAPEFLGKLEQHLTLDNFKVLSIKDLAPRCKDFFIKSDAQGSFEDLKKVLSSFDEAAKEERVDIIVQLNNEHRRNKRLFVFDMDSTLIYQEVIELIAAYANVEDKVAEITERAMNNELDFVQSLRERVALLKGIEVDTLYDEIKAKLKVTEGAPELMKGLRALNCKTAVLSGGFLPFALYIKEKLQLDFAMANTLGTETTVDGKEILSGVTLGQLVDGNFKARTLLSLAKDNGIPVDATVMVGDGGNDLPAMGVAGFGIAWNAKPLVQQTAPSKLNTRSMKDIFYILGLTDAEVENLLK